MRLQNCNILEFFSFLICFSEILINKAKALILKLYLVPLVHFFDQLEFFFFLCFFYGFGINRRSRPYIYFFINVAEITPGGAYVLKKKSVEKFILPPPNSVEKENPTKEVEQLIRLYNEIQKRTVPNEKEHICRQIDAIEHKIDTWVFNLYGINKKE